MALVINTNVASLSAQNSMNKAQMEQSTAMERLTTGKRINTAADDAAGMAIANRMTSQVNGLNQAVRNANDGISMIQTAAGGLEESSNILQRMRELAVQSASGTYDDGNRSSMNAEVEQLKAELDRIADTTTFNGQKILDGSQQDTALQVGADANETINFSIGATDAKSLGSGNSGDVTGTSVSTDLYTSKGPAGNVTINDQEVTVKEIQTASNMGELINVLESEVSGIEVDANVDMVAEDVGTGRLAAGQTLDFTVKELDGTDTTFKVGSTGNMDELVDAINNAAGGRVEASLTDDGKLALYAADATSLAVADGSTGNKAAGFGASQTTQAQLTMTDLSGDGDVSIVYATAADADILGINATTGGNDITGSAAVGKGTSFAAGDLTINGVEIGAYDSSKDYDGNGTANQETDFVAHINSHSAETGVVASLETGNILKLDSVDGEAISVDYKAGQETALKGVLGMNEQNATEGSGGSVNSIDISTAEGAQKAITTLDKAIEQVSSIQGDLGAVENRLDFTVSNLSNVSENAAAARSRIEDSDFASESANLSRAQVLQQASQAMLAQANAAPKQVMSLLQ